jgi:uncharacterized membrane protein
MTHENCFICHKSKKSLVHWAALDENLKQVCQQSFPDANYDEVRICNDCVNDLRIAYIEHILILNKDELSQSEQAILEAYKAKDLISKNSELEYQSSLTFANKLSDLVSRFGGSWYFIILFVLVVITWMMINMLSKPFDPYPFILLNLLLSCIAALQAPIILMSQNRQAARDRISAENDYLTNLKAELEIQFVNAKLDQLMVNQWERLLKIQQMQLELMKKPRAL